MLPSNQQHNTIYRYCYLFSGAQCEVSSITAEAAGDSEHRWLQLLRSSGWCLPLGRPRLLRLGGMAGMDGCPPAQWSRSWPQAGTWKDPRGCGALCVVSAVPPSHCHLRPAGGEGGPARSGRGMSRWSQPCVALPRSRILDLRMVPAPLR